MRRNLRLFRSSTPVTAPASTRPRRCLTSTRSASRCPSTGSTWRSWATCGTGERPIPWLLPCHCTASRLHTISPPGLELLPALATSLMEKGMEIIGHTDIDEVIGDVDVLYVTRIQRERFPDSTSVPQCCLQLPDHPELLAGAKKDLIVLHPLPRVDEIDPRLDASPHARYFEQSKNGVPVRMAMLLEVMG